MQPFISPATVYVRCDFVVFVASSSQLTEIFAKQLHVSHLGGKASLSPHFKA